MHPIVAEDLRQIGSTPLPWGELNGANVLISGAGGVIASCLVDTLLFLNREHDLKIRVTGLVRDPKRVAARFGPSAADDGLELLTQDLACDLSEDVKARRFDFLIHAASHATPSRFGPDPVGTLLPNVIGTRNLLELARDQQARGVLFLSSGEVYGQLPAEALPIAETAQGGLLDPLAVRSCYAESKRVAETMCIAWHHQHGVEARIARLFHTYGPTMPLRDGRVFSDFVADLVERRNLVMKSDGKAVRSYCYLADTVAGCFTVLLMGASGQAYNVGNPQTVVSVSELAERLVGLFPAWGLSVDRVTDSPEGSRGYLPSPMAQSFPDVTKLSGLGWAAKHSLESGFKRTVESFL